MTPDWVLVVSNCTVMGLFGRRNRFETAYETRLKKETSKQTNPRKNRPTKQS